MRKSAINRVVEERSMVSKRVLRGKEKEGWDGAGMQISEMTGEPEAVSREV